MFAFCVTMDSEWSMVYANYNSKLPSTTASEWLMVYASSVCQDIEWLMDFVLPYRVLFCNRLMDKMEIEMLIVSDMTIRYVVSVQIGSILVRTIDVSLSILNAEIIRQMEDVPNAILDMTLMEVIVY